MFESYKKACKLFIGLWIHILSRHLYRLKFNFSAKVIKVVIPILVFIFYVLFVKLPSDREIEAAALTLQINSILGTKLTAVQLLPDQNTTRMQPVFTCQVYHSIIFIKSSQQDYGRRNIIRKTWSNFVFKIEEKVKIFFFISVPSKDEFFLQLVNEASQHNDVIVEDLQESYYLLPLKSLRLLKWINLHADCLKSQFIITTYDDNFLHIPNIISHLNSVPNAWVNYIGGQLQLDDRVETNPRSKRFSPKGWWDDPYYPPFVTSTITIISSEAVPKIIKASVDVPLFHLEDVFIVGMIAFDKLGIVPQNIPRIEMGSEWLIRLKMALSWYDLIKLNLLFHCGDNVKLMQELYERAKA